MYVVRTRVKKGRAKGVITVDITLSCNSSIIPQLKFGLFFALAHQQTDTNHERNLIVAGAPVRYKIGDDQQQNRPIFINYKN